MKSNLHSHREDVQPSADHDDPGLSGVATPGDCAGIPSPESGHWFASLTEHN